MFYNQKIDDTVMQKMLADGKSQKECAVFFGCSEAAISKHLKRQRQTDELPESFQKLTAKQKQFVLARAEGKSNTGAALDAFDCKTTESGHAIGVKLSSDPDIQTAIHDLLHQEGIGKRARIKRLKKVVYAKDLGIAHKGLDTAFKLAGDYAPEKIAIAARVGMELSPEVEDLVSRLTRSLRSSQEGRNVVIDAEVSEGGEVKQLCERISTGENPPNQVETKAPPATQKKAPAKPRREVFPNVDPLYAPRTVPRVEREIMEREERREQQRRRQRDYDPLNR